MTLVSFHLPRVDNFGSYRGFALSLLALFVASVLGAVGYATFQDREALLAAALQRARGNALVFEDQVSQTLQLIENTVHTLPELSAVRLARTAPAQASALLASLQHSLPAVRSLSLLDPGGQVLASSRADNVGHLVDLRDFLPIDVGQLPFSVLRIGSVWVGRDIDAGRASSPELPAAADEPTLVPLLIQIRQEDASIWALIALNPDYLLGRTDRYSQAQSDRFDLVRLDGRTLVSSADEPQGGAYRHAELLQRVQSEELGTAGGATLLAFRSSQRYPFFTSVQIDPQAVLSDWQQRTTRVFTGTVLALSAVVALVLLLMSRIQRDARNEREHQRTILRLSQALEQTPSGILILTPDQRISYSNPSFESLSGYNSEQLRGRKPADLKAEPSESASDGQRQEMLRSGTIWSGEVVQRRRDGSTYTAQVLQAPLRDESGTVTHHILVEHDISPQKKMLRELTAERDRAEAATRAKSEFLANMSHEIRTPMNGLIGMMQLAQDESMSARAHEHLEHAHSAAIMLMGILNDILDFSKIEAGKLVIEPVRLDLGALLRQVLNLHRVAAEKKGVEFTLEQDAGIPDIVVADRLRLAQILNNLLGNAVKFTQHGRITLRVSGDAPDFTRGDAQGLVSLQLRFAVQDSGIGMSAEQVERLFQPFNQADSSTARVYGGTGLGLAICRRLVELMGGTIRVQSSLQHGSTFSFDLPVRAPVLQDALVPPAQAGAGELAPLSGLSLLIVEDTALNRMLVEALLTRAGVQCVMAENGLQALEILKTRADFDMVLMDVQMPLMDGISATRAIRTDPQFDELPVVALTANAMTDDRQNCLDAGMQDYLSKPIDRHALFDALRRWGLPRMAKRTPGLRDTDGAGLRADADRSAVLPAVVPTHPAPRGRGAAAAVSVSPAGPSPALSDRADAIERLDGDEELYLVVLREFSIDQRAADQRIANAIEAGDIALAERLSHNLKGLAATIGAQPLFELARSVNEQLRAPAAQGLAGARLLLPQLHAQLVRTLEEIAALGAGDVR